MISVRPPNTATVPYFLYWVFKQIARLGDYWSWISFKEINKNMGEPWTILAVRNCLSWSRFILTFSAPIYLFYICSRSLNSFICVPFHCKSLDMQFRKSRFLSIWGAHKSSEILQNFEASPDTGYWYVYWILFFLFPLSLFAFTPPWP